MKFGTILIALALAAGAAQAQVSTPPVTPAPPPPAVAPLAGNPYQGMTLSTVTYTMPSMTMLTAGKAAFGALGGLMMMGDGDKLVHSFGLTDPAIAISAGLTPLVAARYQTAGTVALAGQPDNDRDLLAKAAGNQGLVVDVETRTWLVNYFAFDWGHYRLMYNARARLIDGKTGKEVHRIDCDFDTSDAPNRPDFDTMTANNGAILKDWMAQASAACTTTLGNKLLAP
jgi:hypothetical protein